jgi:putative ABC transport system permease protein
MSPVFLALKEIARSKVRFGLLAFAVALLVFLLLFLQTLQSGLLTSFVGAIRNQSAPILVFPVDGRRNLQGSVIVPELELTVRAVDGVGAIGPIEQSTFTVDTREGESDAALIAYADPALGAPETIVEGRLAEGVAEAVASEADAELGFDIGDVVTVQPGGYEITVVGLARDAQYSVSPTLFVDASTYEEATIARNPDAGASLPNVLAVVPADGVSDDELIERINAASEDLDALTRDDAADNAPGVSQVRISFLIITVLLGVIVPFVTGLFFLILTLQKSRPLTLLRAIGAPSGRLVSSLMIQVGIILAAGMGLAVLAYAGFTSGGRLGGVSIRFDPVLVAWVVVGLTVLGFASAFVSAKRVLAIDPIEATTGAGR